MPNLVAELNSLDFSVYIGGPLQAAVQAQNAASMAQASFIQAVGFETIQTDSGTATRLRYVDFSFKKSVANPDYGKTLEQLKQEGRVPSSATAIPGNIKVSERFLENDVTIKVPFLTMLTLPALRIEELTIDFNAKLTSTETSNVSSEFAANAELGINYKIVNFKASASYKRTSTNGTSVEKTYNMGVRVRAINDEIPAGLDRILTMLEDSIASVNG
ncbi:DUF2589 domain-containing protein [Rhodoflexus caldus]|uniref:DUF2589 domain-containing protein n=1 Tax=Rhodoflexus caldus TaxID=2891236 RepID=UPI00202A3753|nr:DUF2589 domain-containing protein [Rhodoflexus caldus]